MKEQFLTKEGLDELKNRLLMLKTTKRRAVAEAIHSAKEQGDLSENAEYVSAKDEQRRIEEEIAELEATIKHARVVTAASTAEVSVGNTVMLDCQGQQKTYRLVGSSEADPMQGKISNESPMGQALVGKKKGEHVRIPAPGGEKECTIISIS